MMKPARCLLYLSCLFALSLFALPVLAELPAIQPGSWTLAILPDTQHYAERFPELLTAQTKFLADAKKKLNLAFVLQEGDITNKNTPAEWQRVSDAFTLLEKAGVDYSIAPGNHDYLAPDKIVGPRAASLMSKYFPVNRLKKQATFGGLFPGEPNLPNNTYSLFSAGGTDWLILSLEVGPRDKVVDWADQIMKKFPQRKVMLQTHAYLYFDNSRYDWRTKGKKQSWNPHYYGFINQPGGVNDGEELWQKLKNNANLKFVFCGHVLADGAGYGISRGDHGNVVHQMLANYQFLPNGGMGYMRLLEFLPDGETVLVRTYSPWLDQQGKDPNRMEPDQNFIIKLSTVPPIKRAAPVPKKEKASKKAEAA